MRFLTSIMMVSIMALMAFATGCSSADSTPFFQNNHVSGEPGVTTDPFADLPDVVALLDTAGETVSAIGELFNPGNFNLNMAAPEYRTFVDNVKEIVNNPLPDGVGDSDVNEFRRTAAFDVLTDVVPSLADDYGTDHGAYGLFAVLRDLVGYLIDQESLDGSDSGDYIDELYAYMNKIDDAELNMKHDAYGIMNKGIGFAYQRYTVDANVVEARMSDLQGFLSDNTGQTITSLLLNIQEAMGKILLRADSEIYFDDPLDYDGSGFDYINIELGNSVAGVDYLLQGISDMLMNDADARQNLYGILIEGGKLIRSLKGSSSPYYPALKGLLKNIEDYFTVGGSVYDSTTPATKANYNHVVAASPNNYYVNAELRNGIRELWPGLAKLFIRERAGGSSDPDYSIIYSDNHQRSPVELLTMALYQLKKGGINYSNETDYALEPSLKQAIAYNALGELRSGSSYSLSFLDHLMCTIAVGYTYGYKTRVMPGLNDDDEPYANAPSGAEGNSYIHGKQTGGILTLNDTMYSIMNTGIHTTATAAMCVNVLDVWSDSYSLALAGRLSQGTHSWRSSSSFTYNDANKANYQFYMGYDYPALGLLPATCAGDVGIPQGGQKAITPTTDATGNDGTVNDYRTYFPKVADGMGDLNTATWIFSWIARTCWDGAGPYYSTAGALIDQTNADMADLGYPQWVGTPPATFNVYFKPNGEVYAYVDTSGDPYRYYYPVTGNDVVDPDASANSQRYNRYRDICRSDYYMVQNGHEHSGSTILNLVLTLFSEANDAAYCVPPMNPSGTAFAEGTTGANKYRLTTGTSTHSAQYFQVYEKVIEWDNDDRDDASDSDANYYFIGNLKRARATQEEAMYRNYQWLMLEKKFLFVIPLNLGTGWGVLSGTAYLDSAAFVLIEGNGFVGSTLAAKGSANGCWLLKNGGGTEGVNADIAGHRNAPDYGNSLRPGDARILALAKYYDANDYLTGSAEGLTSMTGKQVTPDVVFSLLGTGHVMPDVVGANIGPVARMGFVDQTSYIPSNFDTSSGTLWTNRNKLLPIIVALAGVLRDGTYYQPTTGNNYNYAGHHKYPLKEMVENIMFPLSKPYLRLWDNGTTTWVKRWVPRIDNESSGRFSYFMPRGQGSFALAQDYYFGAGAHTYPTSPMLRTLVSFMADTSTSTYADGLIPALDSSNNRMVTKLLAFLQGMGNNDMGSVYRDDELGILMNVGKGLEQVVTGIQVSQGAVTTNSYGYLDDQRYHWMYTNGHGISRTSGTPAPISVDLDVALNELIGDNTRGLSKFVDNHETPTDGSAAAVTDPAKWANYDLLLDAAGEMMGDSTSDYYMMGEYIAANPPETQTQHGTLIHIINNMLTKVTMTSPDRKALRHTLGIMMARYPSGGPWTTNTELRDILLHYLPEVMTSASGHYENLLVALKSLIDKDFDGTMEPEVLDYLVDLLIHGDRAEEIVPEMYDLLNNPSMTDSAYYNSSYPNKATLKELVDICSELSLEIEDYL